MQPIIQASLDPKLNDIRHFRADQEFYVVIDCFGPISPSPRVKTSRTYFESYLLYCKTTFFPEENESFEATHWTAHQVPGQQALDAATGTDTQRLAPGKPRISGEVGLCA